MNNSNQMKLRMFEDMINNMDDKNQILMHAESTKMSYWWLSIIVSGLGQMINGAVGKGVALFLFSWLIIPYIYGIVDAHSMQSEFNNHIDLLVSKKLKSLNQPGHLKHNENSSNVLPQAEINQEYALCPNCGEKNEGDSKFCQNCGEKI